MPAIRASKPRTPPTTPPAIAPTSEDRFEAFCGPVTPTTAVDEDDVVVSDDVAELSPDCEGEEAAELPEELPA